MNAAMNEHNMNEATNKSRFSKESLPEKNINDLI